MSSVELNVLCLIDFKKAVKKNTNNLQKASRTDLNQNKSASLKLKLKMRGITKTLNIRGYPIILGPNLILYKQIKSKNGGQRQTDDEEEEEKKHWKSERRRNED